MKQTYNPQYARVNFTDRQHEYDFNKPYRENGLLSLIIKVLFALILVAAGLGITYMVASAQVNSNVPQAVWYAHNPRWDACRTYDVGGIDATDGISCDIALDDTQQQSKQRNETTHIIPLGSSVPTVSVLPVPIQDNPIVDPLQDDDTVSDDGKRHCNKGSGNGSEGCDPGNHPEKGNNDEGGDCHPDNSNHNQESKDESGGNGRGKGRGKNK